MRVKYTGIRDAYTCVSALERERAPRMEVGRLGQERRRKEGRKEGEERRGGGEGRW